jgi:hypothetical protein
MCWHCELADRLSARAETEPIEAERDALLCMALEQSCAATERREHHD